MFCQRCHTREAVNRNGDPVSCHLFGEIDGYFCAECVLDLQQPYEAALRQAIAERAPTVTEHDLAGVPDQMLKFTISLPIPTQGPA